MTVLGADLRLASGVTSGLVVAIGLIPVWWPFIRRFVAARAVLLVFAVALATGLWLAAGAAPAHSVDVVKARQTVLLLVTAFGGVGVLLWARTVMPLHRIGVAYGVGALLSAASRVPGSSNSWKYELAFPVTVVVLAAVGRLRSYTLTVLVLTGLGLVGITHEYRSYVGFCLLSAALGFQQARGRGGRPQRHRVSIAVGIVGLTAALYYLGTAALVQGYLGSTLQARSTQQLAESGSLVLGGRPEWAATVRLMQQRPVGFGLGVVPLPSDRQRGRSGLTDIGIPPDQKRDDYMFGGQFRLHSIAADLWVNLGVPGLALGALLVAVLAKALVTSLAHHRASALQVFLALVAVWDLCFGPIYTNLQDVTLAVGMTLLVRRHRAAGHKSPADPDGERLARTGTPAGVRPAACSVPSRA